MISERIKMTQEQYENYLNATPSMKNAAILAVIPSWERMAFGVFGLHLEEKDGEHYVCYHRLDTCD